MRIGGDGREDPRKKNVEVQRFRVKLSGEKATLVHGSRVGEKKRKRTLGTMRIWGWNKQQVSKRILWSSSIKGKEVLIKLCIQKKETFTFPVRSGRNGKQGIEHRMENRGHKRLRDGPMRDKNRLRLSSGLILMILDLHEKNRLRRLVGEKGESGKKGEFLGISASQVVL